MDISTWSPSAPNAALAAFAAFTVFVAAAYLAIGLHPERLRDVPGAATFYGAALQLFPIAHIGVGAAALVVALTAAVGSRWIPSFILLYGISLASELLGTGVGIPFGTYHYSALLGPAWEGRVPAVIPLSWFMMAIPAYALARAAIPATRRWLVPPVAALILLFWDLILDPAMSRATSYWVWGNGGGSAYYGMPLTNLLGWFVTGLALMFALTALGVGRWITDVPPEWMAMFYAAVLFLPLAICIGAGLWIPVALTAVAVVALARMVA